MYYILCNLFPYCTDTNMLQRLTYFKVNSKTIIEQVLYAYLRVGSITAYLAT